MITPTDLGERPAAGSPALLTKLHPGSEQTLLALPYFAFQCWMALADWGLRRWVAAPLPSEHPWHEPHDQLVVPDPIEADGERDLFA